MLKNYKLYNGNNIDILKAFPENSIDSVVTDPPYGLQFMAKAWDYDVPKIETWKEVLRVLKPGGHLLSFFGTRTYHRGVVAIEDAGFEIRDQIQWLYGSGFPKSYDVSKGIDKKLGAERKVVGTTKSGGFARMMQTNEEQGFRPDNYYKDGNHFVSNEAITEEAKEWQGWGTALKPANEPIVLARKPLEENTVAENVMKYGTGALNIDDCRVNYSSDYDKKHQEDIKRGQENATKGTMFGGKTTKSLPSTLEAQGRWPANVIHDGSEEVLALFPTTGKSASVKGNEPSPVTQDIYGKFNNRVPFEAYGDEGSAARFFYCAKTSKSDREEGLDSFKAKHTASAEFRPNHMEKALEGDEGNPYGRWTPLKNNHPTVKPTTLMQYLCKLITPKGGTVLDPFMGSGSTGKAAALDKFKFIGIELDKGYFEIAEARIKKAYEPKGLEKFYGKKKAS